MHARLALALIALGCAPAARPLPPTTPKAGHAGGRSLTKVIDDTTMELAFLARELGMTAP
jgi:hypothetical protein